MKQSKLNTQDGIALGPILFIIAILAVIAAAIAAGAGSFNANTGTESVKATARVSSKKANSSKMASKTSFLQTESIRPMRFTIRR